ncbi:MAG: DMT family transporter [Clostridia bacterium]|nr:DMT family transporter [Clostridia bacterium]NCC44168.1 DMT family transporter [Clostridia bacterium]
MNRKSILYILLTAFCFGTLEVASKLAGASFNSIQLVFLRFVIGGVILLPFAIRDIKAKNLKLDKGDWLYLLCLGIICVCISMAMLQIGVKMINANLASILISINPVFTMVFAHFIVNDRFTKRKAVVLGVSLAGLLIVANPAKIFSGEISIEGLLITLAAAISFGLYTALGKLRLQKLGGMVQNTFSFLLGSAVLLVFMIFSGTPIIEGINLSTLPLLLYLGIVVTGLGYFAFMKAIAMAGPSNASIAFFIKPVLAPVMSLLILKESVTWNFMLGVVFILAGSLINMNVLFRKKS